MRRSVRSEVDFVLTFEEMTGIFSAKHVDLENIEEDTAGVSDEDVYKRQPLSCMSPSFQEAQ